MAILPPEQMQFLQAISAPRWPGRAEIEATYQRWAELGAEVELRGLSTAGREIKTATIGSGAKTLLAWGYPHPDEPIGAAALIALGDALLAGDLNLPDWRVVLVLVADPDGLERNRWIAEQRPYLQGCWRPINLDDDVDSGFAVDCQYWETPLAGRCRQYGECSMLCSALTDCALADNPPGPLAETAVLQQLLEELQPELVATMHSTHTGGDYTFLLRRESEGVFNDLLALPAALGSVRHLGERIDPGRRWRRNAPDLLREYDLSWAQRALKRYAHLGPDACFRGPAPLGLFVDLRLPEKTQVITPESALYRSADFGNQQETDKTVRLRESVEHRRRGDYWVRRFFHRRQWLIADMERLPDGSRRRGRDQRQPVPRSVAGQRALLARRSARERAEEVWQLLDPEVLSNNRDHPYLLERQRSTEMPGAGLQRYLLSDRQFRRPATVAQQATFEQIWGLHTVMVIANMRTFLEDCQDLDSAAGQALEELLAELYNPLQLPEADRAVSIRSQLGRILRLVNARQ